MVLEHDTQRCFIIIPIFFRGEGRITLVACPPPAHLQGTTEYAPPLSLNDSVCMNEGMLSLLVCTLLYLVFRLVPLPDDAQGGGKHGGESGRPNSGSEDVCSGVD